jgi:hypothetical protein
MQKHLCSVFLLLSILFLIMIPEPLASTINVSAPSSVITDIQLRVSNKSKPPSAPGGYNLKGYWDVQGEKSQDSVGNTGHWMMGLYSKSETPQEVSCCIQDIQLRF